MTSKYAELTVNLNDPKFTQEGIHKQVIPLREINTEKIVWIKCSGIEVKIEGLSEKRCRAIDEYQRRNKRQ